jgi:hypothetical protein
LSLRLATRGLEENINRGRPDHWMAEDIDGASTFCSPPAPINLIFGFSLHYNN